MHSSDRTLLAKLGFSDPDKQDNKHDLACQYVACIRNKLFCHFIPEQDDVEDIHFALEAPVYKGAKQYKSLVGFLDVVLYTGTRGTITAANVNPGRNNTYINYISECSYFKKHIALEVKTNPVSIGNLLAQMNVYKEHHANASPLSNFEDINGEKLIVVNWGNGLKRLDPVWVVATTFKMSIIDKDTLENEGIKHIYLGAPFDEFCKMYGPEDSPSESW